MLIGKKIMGLCAVFCLFGLTAFAQQTSTIMGKVTLDTGDPLPGVVVTIESPALQGSRSAVTAENGEFLIRLLPPGDYQITATMVGMKTATQEFRVGLGQTARPRIILAPEVAETLIVTAEAESILDTTEVSSNMEFDKLESLPAGRTINSAILLAPGVSSGGPNGGITISGAQSFENLFLINGVVVNEQVRGQAHSAYIEDAIQEVSVLTGAISAEYGNFTGGVVNTITKSGGNEFAGTFRVHFDNDAWQEEAPGQVDPYVDKVNHVETFTFGGPILKDRLWFFLAGRRQRDESQTTISAGTAIPDRVARQLGLDQGQWAPPEHQWPHGLDDDRYEIKLTGLLHEGHTLVASYTNRDTTEINDAQFGVLNESAIVQERMLPNTLLNFTYRGILTSELTMEVLYSVKEFTFENAGGQYRDPVLGSAIEASDQGYDNIGAPFFSNERPEERDNRTFYVKVSYFLTTDQYGSHDIVAGFSDFQESRTADNHQSGSDFRLFNSWTRWNAPANPNDPLGEGVFPVAIPIFTADFASRISYWPILNSSQGSDFTVQSAYLNDSWTLNDHWRFNIGLRYDANDTKAQDGTLLSDDSSISPRLAVSYDIRGDGSHTIGLSYGQYVARLANVADGISSAGTPASMFWYYYGPTTESLEELFNWFYETYDVPAFDPNNPDAFQDGIVNNAEAVAGAYSINFPGVTTVIPEPLESPDVTEYVLGYSTRLGNNGFVKLDYTIREYDKFYMNRIDQGTGTVEISEGQLDDLAYLVNSDGEYTRDYSSVQVQADYRFNDKFSMGGNYTWSRLTGNIVGETSGSGSIATSSTTAYPEYNDYPGRNPVGYLTGDQRHRVNVWGVYTWPTKFGTFDFSLLEKFQSGEPYEYFGSWSIGRDLDVFYGEEKANELNSLNYTNPPTSVGYYITPRGSLRVDDYFRTDISINYTLNIKKLELFVQFEMFNLFNEEAYLLANPNVSIDTTGFPGFNVYTETPVEGVNYAIDESDLVPGGYQNPRWYQFDVGFKF